MLQSMKLVSQEWKHGFDCGLNGPDKRNSFFLNFATEKQKNDWEEGKRVGEKFKLDRQFATVKLQKFVENPCDELVLTEEEFHSLDPWTMGFAKITLQFWPGLKYKKDNPFEPGTEKAKHFQQGETAAERMHIKKAYGKDN